LRIIYQMVKRTLGVHLRLKDITQQKDKNLVDLDELWVQVNMWREKEMPVVKNNKRSLNAAREIQI